MDDNKQTLQVRCEYGSQQTLEELIAQSFAVFCRSVLQSADCDGPDDARLQQ